MLAPPIHLSESNVEMVRAPLLGEHTGDVLGRELGLDGAALEALAASGVVGFAEPVPTPA
jgi:formyl-CoA transferase